MAAIDDAVEINASAEAVWAIVTEFVGYSQWNPFMTKASGKAQEGERIEIAFKLGDKGAQAIHPKITFVKEPKELHWRAYLAAGLGKWEHVLHVEDFHEGHVVIAQRATFTGLTGERFGRKNDEDLKAGMRAMNEAIKHRAESNAPVGSRSYVT